MIRINYSIAVNAIKSNIFRSFLTTLGIIFGVSAVISMLSINESARKEIIDEIKKLGLNNIIINDGSDNYFDSKNNIDFSANNSGKNKPLTDTGDLNLDYDFNYIPFTQVICLLILWIFFTCFILSSGIGSISFMILSTSIISINFDCSLITPVIAEVVEAIID